jgi:hypothetical protein
MDIVTVGQWTSVLSDAVTALSLLVAASLFAFDLKLRRYEVRERASRAQASINVSVDERLVPTRSGQLVLEVSVSLRNVGERSWCVPAVYVSGRALAIGQDSHALGGFEGLPPAGPLSIPRNVARLESSIIQVGPGEEESFCRWDLLEAGFTREYPAIVLRVEVFSAASELLGVDERDTPRSDFRGEWLRFMNGESGEDLSRHKKMIIDRAPTDTQDVRAGQRVLLLPDSDAVDYDGSRRFRRVLDSVVQWSRQKTVVLGVVPGP